MKISKIQLSNILSFPYAENIEDAVEIKVDPTLSVIIGGNGSGKSTALDAISFLFRRAILKPYNFDHDTFSNPVGSRKQDSLRVLPEMENYKNSFRLNHNWNSEDKAQKIAATIVLDDVDTSNLSIIKDNYSKIRSTISKYSRARIPSAFNLDNGTEEINLVVVLDSDNDKFAVSHDTNEEIFSYLSDYELYKEAISLYNISAVDEDSIPQLSDTFTMLSAFRNYHSFNGSVSLTSDPLYQLRSISANNYRQGINTSQGEPSIFSVVKLQVASKQYDLSRGNMTDEESEKEANKAEILKKINNKLAIINLRCSVKLLDRRNWSYSFEFYDTKHRRVMGDINSLSAGQRSIIHLTFEAYGRDTLKGGVVVIDEPEIHLHYQFQHEYHQIMKEIITEQKMQYILVTHSDAFVNYDTASYIKRFALNENRQSVVYSPKLTETQESLVRILDNTQSARALFGNKIVLVEGQNDRYFLRSLFSYLYPELDQEVSIFDAGSRDSIPEWKEFFEKFGLIVYQIKDLDAAFEDIYRDRSKYSLKSDSAKTKFRSDHANLSEDIERLYSDRLYILKLGDIEDYMQINSKKLHTVIQYCDEIEKFVADETDQKKEMLGIIGEIVK
ncbi:AAA family ATPase [Candidatus Saccharibacteria bacterium]|nr:AAA family ATPase [Candidatus Saccharibacteria bacterium]